MLSLWYIILGWKEYNKPFPKGERGGKPGDPVKKPDLIPQRKDVKATEPIQVKKPETPESPPGAEPRPPAALPARAVEVPKPKTPETPQKPEPPKVVPKMPEISKVPDRPKVLPKTPEAPKAPEFKPSPEIPKKPETPKLPGRSEFGPDAPIPAVGTPKTPEISKTLEELPNVMIPSRRPESVMPEFPASRRDPARGPAAEPSEFPLPPYLPGTPQKKTSAAAEDELFAFGTRFDDPSKLSGNLRDLSYPRSRSPADEVAATARDGLAKVPKYMEHSVISNPDSLESDEDDE